MIALLMKLGLGKRLAQIVAYVGLPLLVLLAFWIALHAYGNSRYHEGKADQRAEYEAASRKLVQQAAVSATKADDAATVRVAQHVEQITRQQEKIDEAQQNGSSTFDVLFGDAH